MRVDLRPVIRTVCFLFIVGIIVPIGTPAVAQVTELFAEPFDELLFYDPDPNDPNPPGPEPTDVWQAIAGGKPNGTLAVDGGCIPDFDCILSMSSNNPFTFPNTFSLSDHVGTLGIETINPVSISGLTNVTIDARLRPQNTGALRGIELAVLGSSGGWTQMTSRGNYEGQVFLFEGEEVFMPSQSADFNNDYTPPSGGGVLGSDLPIWQSGYGLSGTATPRDGDANLDGNVNGADFLWWQTHYLDGSQAPGEGPNDFPNNSEDWADVYQSSGGYAHSDHFNHCEDTLLPCDMFRRFKVTIDTEGTTLEIFSSLDKNDETPAFNLSHRRFSGLTIDDLGSELQLVLRQEPDRANNGSAQARVDEIFVTTDPSYVPPSAFGASSGFGALSAANTTVPEPSTLALFVVLIAARLSMARHDAGLLA